MAALPSEFLQLLRYSGGPLEASGTNFLVVLLLYVGSYSSLTYQALGMPEYSKVSIHLTTASLLSGHLKDERLFLYKLEE